ncbi:PKD domain protein [uncultured archaeon]|nr:PKD domain protein [uncultured archaeon]
MKQKILFGILFTVAFLSFTSASFSLGTPAYQIEKSYAPGDSLRGWINLKLDSETNGVVSDTKGNSVYLLDLIKNSSSAVNYSCSPSKCMKDYAASNAQASKTINAVENQVILVGAKIEGNLSIDGVTAMNLTIQSDAQANCRNQLIVDMLDDNSADIVNLKPSASACSSTKTYGCYDTTKANAEAKLYGTPYCQKVHLNPAPAHELGALVSRIGSEKSLRMLLFSLGNATVPSQKLVECNLEKKLPHDYAEEFCVTSGYSIDKEGDYFVCIMSDDGSVEDKIKAYQDLTNGCGFSGNPIDNPQQTFSYSLFAQSKKYDIPGAVSLGEEKYSQWSLGPLYNDYLKKKYGNMDCTNGCILPVRIIANSAQKITVKDLKLTYSTIGFGQQTKAELYDLVESPVTITTPDFQKISVDSGKFLVSSVFGQETVTLSLNGNSLFSDTVTIKEVPTPVSITPTVVPAAVPTDFIVFVSPPTNITGYQWDFGDGKTEATTSNRATHSYAKIGSFMLTVSATNVNNEKGSKSFNITVQSPEGFVNTTLKEKKDKVEEIKNSIKIGFSPFEQTAITDTIDVPYLESEIQRIQVAYAKAGNNSATYVQLMSDLVNLKVPDEISVGKSAEAISFYPNQDLIDFSLYSQVETSSLNYSGEDFSKLVSKWNLQNLDTLVTYKEILGMYGGNPETLVNSFDIELKKKTDFSYSPILFMENLEGMKFGGEYNPRNLSGYIYFPLKDKSTRFVFVTTQKDIDFTNVPLFVAPNLENLGIQEKPQPKNTTSIWIWFAIALGGLFVIVIVVYFILQKWYSTKYEEFLFKDKNEFYNLAAFIDNAKKSGQNESEIESRLRKAGWKSEQIKFAMKKYTGKETGMVKLPLTGKTSAKKPVSSPPQRPRSLPSVNPKKVFRK